MNESSRKIILHIPMDRAMDDIFFRAVPTWNKVFIYD